MASKGAKREEGAREEGEREEGEREEGEREEGEREEGERETINILADSYFLALLIALLHPLS